MREHEVVGVERGCDLPAGSAHVCMASDIAGEERTAFPSVRAHAHQHLLRYDFVDHACEGEFGTLRHLRFCAGVEYFFFVRHDDLFAIHDLEN